MRTTKRISYLLHAVAALVGAFACMLALIDSLQEHREDPWRYAYALALACAFGVNISYLGAVVRMRAPGSPPCGGSSVPHDSDEQNQVCHYWAEKQNDRKPSASGVWRG